MSSIARTGQPSRRYCPASILADTYYGREQWEDTEPLYDLLLRKVDKSSKDFREDMLGEKFVNSLFDHNLIDENDIEVASTAKDADTPEFWERRVRSKLFRAVNWLREQGFDVDVKLRDQRVKQLPGQTSLDDHMMGAH